MSHQDANRAINALVRNAETLSALGAILSGIAGQAEAHPHVAEKCTAVQQAIDPDLFKDLTKDEAQSLLVTIVARVRRALELVEAPGQTPAWVPEDPVVLQTQGRSSRIVTTLISDFAERDESLRCLLAEPARFLDVGSGAGWISISMAERWPGLSVDGLDIHVPALDLAHQNLQAAGLEDRVAFRNLSVAELDAPEAYAAAFIPFIFIPEGVLQSAMPALGRAVRKGGWLFVACYREPEGALDRALWDLQTTTSGGRVWATDEITRLLEANGFRFVEDIGVDRPINLYAAQRV